MAMGDRQRRDGTAKRVQLTSGDHAGPKDKKGRKARTAKPGQAQQKAAAAREWKRLFARLDEVRKRDAERQRRRKQR
ncbi:MULTISPECIES: hypothetical protein [Streptomyces]